MYTKKIKYTALFIEVEPNYNEFTLTVNGDSDEDAIQRALRAENILNTDETKIILHEVTKEQITVIY